VFILLLIVFKIECMKYGFLLCFEFVVDIFKVGFFFLFFLIIFYEIYF